MKKSYRTSRISMASSGRRLIIDRRCRYLGVSVRWVGRRQIRRLIMISPWSKTNCKLRHRWWVSEQLTGVLAIRTSKTWLTSERSSRRRRRTEGSLQSKLARKMKNSNEWRQNWKWWKVTKSKNLNHPRSRGLSPCRERTIRSLPLRQRSGHSLKLLRQAIRPEKDCINR